MTTQLDRIEAQLQTVLENQNELIIAFATAKTSPVPPGPVVPSYAGGTIYQPPGSPNGVNASGTTISVPLVVTEAKPQQIGASRIDGTQDAPIKGFKIKDGFGNVIADVPVVNAAGKGLSIFQVGITTTLQPGTYFIDIDCGTPNAAYVYSQNA